ncbi:MAG: SAM-dependent methyltransferase [Acidobacteriota bacterium]|nr:SAM-dependent methyltransferase [Acidobacteriota bacterium]
MSESPHTLAAQLRERIERDGPITFRDWMEAALYDPQGGYYQRADLTRWGRAGDYRTSAERSPLFAATFAQYFAALDEELSAPHPFTIIESGAGDGSFARSVLETLRRDHPETFPRIHYLIDELSDDARQRIKHTLGEFVEQTAFVQLSDQEEPIGEGLIFTNELLDALPVHRVTMRDGKLSEFYVGLNEMCEFVWVEREPSTPRLIEHLLHHQINLEEGQIVEINLAAADWTARAEKLLQRGFLITVDYGAEASELYHDPRRHTGTLRAFRRHQFAGNVLASPGEQDLTTTIDWTQIRTAGEAAGLQTILFEPQDQFLLRAGLLEQLELLTASAADEAERVNLRLAARELILPGGMSGSFQVLVQEKFSVFSKTKSQN